MLFNVDCGAVLLSLISWADANQAGICFGAKHPQSFTLAGPHVANTLSFENPTQPLTVGTVEEFIEDFLHRHPEAKVDYVHDEPAVRQLCCKGGVAFLLPPFEKTDLFKGVVLGACCPARPSAWAMRRKNAITLSAGRSTRHSDQTLHRQGSFVPKRPQKDDTGNPGGAF